MNFKARFGIAIGIDQVIDAGLRRCREVTRQMPFTLAAVVLAITADNLTTAITLNRGVGLEANPVSAALLGFGAGWLYGIKYAAVLVLVAVLSFFEPSERRFLRWVVLLSAVALVGISLHNLSLG